MASTTSATNISTTVKHTASPPGFEPTKPQDPPRSSGSMRRSSEIPALKPIIEAEQPYAKLLMPEPPSEMDAPGKREERIEEILLYNYYLFGHKRNKDWRTIPAFEEVDDPLPPLDDVSDYEEDEEMSPSEEARSDEEGSPQRSDS